MRLWQRILITLVLAPLVWQLGEAYLGSTHGGAVGTLAAAALSSLPKLYLVYSLPALVAILVLLVPAERLLALIGADLLVVAAAPALALAVPIVLARFVEDPRLDAAPLYALAFVYGLVFGLTIREPVRRSETLDAHA